MEWQLRNVMQSSMTATLPRRQTKLESHIDSLKRHLNDCTDSHQKDPYTRITTEIAAYVATSPINGSDVKIEIETIHDCLPPNATAEQKRRCGKQNWRKQKKWSDPERKYRNTVSIVWGHVSFALQHRIQSPELQDKENSS